MNDPPKMAYRSTKRSNRSEADAPRANRQKQYSEAELAARERQLQSERKRQIVRRRAENERKGIIKTHPIAPLNSNDATAADIVANIERLYAEGRTEAAEGLRRRGLELGLLREIAKDDTIESQNDKEVKSYAERQESGGGSAAEQSAEGRYISAEDYREEFSRRFGGYEGGVRQSDAGVDRSGTQDAGVRENAQAPVQDKRKRGVRARFRGNQATINSAFADLAAEEKTGTKITALMKM